MRVARGNGCVEMYCESVLRKRSSDGASGFHRRSKSIFYRRLDSTHSVVASVIKSVLGAWGIRPNFWMPYNTSRRSSYVSRL